MAVKLEGIALPDDIQWVDEFSGFGVGQTITPTLTGALVVEEAAQPAGRKITLRSDRDVWVERSVVQQLAALAATPLDGATLTLSWHGTDYDVVFDRSQGDGFSASEVLRLAGSAQGADHPYEISINLITA